jgi:acyl carrier protein
MQNRDIVRQFVMDTLVLDGSRADVGDDDLLVEDGIIDSMGILTMLTFLEERFGISVDGDELTPENFQSIQAIAALVERKTDHSEH